ncbi:hypothetical protein V5799_024559 [Amblyomma americanum]|uniref:Uncharacterized protein n=1 Tax=Amblyomma americanum TaxID=6943 RepID=A0AAQ4EBP1_AMBAM
MPTGTTRRSVAPPLLMSPIIVFYVTYASDSSTVYQFTLDNVNKDQCFVGHCNFSERLSYAHRAASVLSSSSASCRLKRFHFGNVHLYELARTGAYRPENMLMYEDSMCE